MYKINKLCGLNDYSVIFDKSLDIDKVISLFRDYSILEKTKEFAKLNNNDKKVLVYSYGEIVFLNFSIEEIENICKKIEKI